jgi:methyl-accepting chemotaxis protein
MLLLMIIVGGFSLSRMSAINSKVQEINSSWMPGVKSINNINYLTEHVATLTLRHVMNIGNKSDIEKERADTITKITQTLDDYEKTIFLAEDRTKFTELKSEWQSYLEKNNKVIESSNTNDKQGVMINLSAAKHQLDAMKTNLDALVKINSDGSQKAASESSAIFNTSVWTISLLLLFSIIIGIAITTFLVKTITKRLIMVTDTIGKVAKGDLTVQPLIVKSNDEISALARSSNEMSTNLRELISKIADNSDQVAASAEELSASAEQTGKATEQIAHTVQEVASGTDKQMQSVEESSRTISELAVGVQQIANGGEIIDVSVTHTLERAAEGEKNIQLVMKQMNAISDTFGNLSDSVKALGERSNEIAKLYRLLRIFLLKQICSL